MKVRDFMITKVYTVKPSNTVHELLDLFTSKRIGGVPVVDDRGQLRGMVSDGDILRYLSPALIGFAALVYVVEERGTEDMIRERLDTQIKEIMTKRNLLYVSPDDEFVRALRILSRHRGRTCHWRT